ncbi:hypothetical protein [Salinibacillus aidingensis]|uniref:hypothetical protein n=1 Tax=Salinibacillus aidingensis TaxID=237684 RepID=UPI0031DF7BCA
MGTVSFPTMLIKEKVESVGKLRAFVPLMDISPDFTGTVVAMEDHRFYQALTGRNTPTSRL